VLGLGRDAILYGPDMLITCAKSRAGGKWTC
jgi:hypothetical protein